MTKLTIKKFKFSSILSAIDSRHWNFEITEIPDVNNIEIHA